MSYLTVETIRQELQDLSPDDNAIDCDYAFSDEEIEHAMKRCASAYNSMSPLGIDNKSAYSLPDMGLFMDGVLWCLYRSAKNKLARNQLEWSTGNVTVNMGKMRLQLYDQLAKEYEQTFKEAAKERKTEINRGLAWGSW